MVEAAGINTFRSSMRLVGRRTYAKEVAELRGRPTAEPARA